MNAKLNIFKHIVKLNIKLPKWLWTVVDVFIWLYIVIFLNFRIIWGDFNISHNIYKIYTCKIKYYKISVACKTRNKDIWNEWEYPI